MVQFIKQNAVNSHSIALGNPTLPYASERLVKLSFWSTSHDFFNKAHILAFRKNESELFIGCRKDVVDRVVGTVDDLDIFHAL